MEKNSADILISNNLQSYFYMILEKANLSCPMPVRQETVVYSSAVLDKYSQPETFFEVKDGKLSEKILALKYLESADLSIEDKKRTLKDIGDTSLFLCGYFSKSLEKKIVDVNYYMDMGKIAYNNLDSFVPEFFEINNFYKKLSHNFENVVQLISVISSKKSKTDLII